jgi:hypothetical protein
MPIQALERSATAIRVVVAPRRPPRDHAVDTSKPGVSATDRKAVRKQGMRAGRKAAYALERSSGRPSRRSTRKSANRQRSDVKSRKQRRANQGGPGSGGRRRPRGTLR